jgi:hypothetical protein
MSKTAPGSFGAMNGRTLGGKTVVHPAACFESAESDRSVKRDLFGRRMRSFYRKGSASLKNLCGLAVTLNGFKSKILKGFA